MLTKKEFNFVKGLLKDGYTQRQIAMALEDGEYLSKTPLTQDEVENISHRLKGNKNITYKIMVKGSITGDWVAAYRATGNTPKEAIADFYSVFPAMKGNDDFIVKAVRK
jgi:hypothetical protein